MDPKGEVRARVTYVYDIPRTFPEAYLINIQFTYSPVDPPNWELGRWQVEVTINGAAEGERTFEVVQ